jgi:hypothetical protein
MSSHASKRNLHSRLSAPQSNDSSRSHHYNASSNSYNISTRHNGETRHDVISPSQMPQDRVNDNTPMLFPRSHPTPEKESEQLLRFQQSAARQAMEQQSPAPKYAQSWSPNNSYHQKSFENDSNRLVERNHLPFLVSPSTTRTRKQPSHKVTAKTTGSDDTTHETLGNAASSSSYVSPPRNDPGTPRSSQERIQTYLKQRHAHAIKKTQQKCIGTNTIMTINHNLVAAKEQSKTRHEEKKDDDSLTETKSKQPTTRLQTLHREQSKSQKYVPGPIKFSTVAPESMNTTSTDDSTLTTSASMRQVEPMILLEFEKPASHKNYDTATTAQTSKSIHAAHLAHQHAPFQRRKHCNMDSDQVVQPPALVRRLANDETFPKQSSEKSMPTTKEASQSSRVQTMKQHLWDEQSEKLKPQTEAWQRNNNKTINEKKVQTPTQISQPQIQFERDDKPLVRQDDFYKSRFAQSYSVPLAESLKRHP